MADKKVDATTGEVQEQEEKKFQYFDRNKEELDQQGPIETMSNMYYGPTPNLLLVHCKPVFNYQSVEFDFFIRDANNIPEMEELYSKMLAMLVRVSQNAPQVEAKKTVAPVEEPATEAQKQILRNFHIDFKEPLTKKQAHALIKKSMDQEVF